MKRHPRRAVDALELPHADQRKCPARSRERSGKVAKPAHRAIDARDAATVRRVFAERRRRAGPAAASTLSVLISHTVARGEVSTAEQNMAAADVHAPRAAATATLTNKDEISLETLSGIKPYKSFQGVTTGKVKSARVDMGGTRSFRQRNPRALLTATGLWVRTLPRRQWAIKSLRAFPGNPHCITYVDDVKRDLAKAGPVFWLNECSPDRGEHRIYIHIISETEFDTRLGARLEAKLPAEQARAPPQVTKRAERLLPQKYRHPKGKSHKAGDFYSYKVDK